MIENSFAVIFANEFLFYSEEELAGLKELKNVILDRQKNNEVRKNAIPFFIPFKNYSRKYIN
ncbi:hypothetical protein KHA93_06475 [Bacillus sp. FJAT-49732]|uniref:Uncharacterized protein n=1 Tax=Lederbergia citrisecunda TaxID=2833583 RepID=A0A942TKH7_9BACI|nr:hypothetical protein [Lederbergia citrisecunda]MBS4199300.1 hypothetical protein [Lederbergia citrisecunda]